ncbi:hypothetical protein PMIN06_009222 [Paraphaeosphaeria minitans]
MLSSIFTHSIPQCAATSTKHSIPSHKGLGTAYNLYVLVTCSITSTWCFSRRSLGSMLMPAVASSRAHKTSSPKKASSSEDVPVTTTFGEEDCSSVQMSLFGLLSLLGEHLV